MSTLRWSWTVRFAPFARATLASQPWLLLAPLLLGAGFALLSPQVWGSTNRVLLGVGVAVLVAVFWLSSLNRQLRRRRNTTRGKVQDYELDAGTLALSVGRDRYTLPLSELVVARQGVDWLAVRRVGAGRRPLLLFFDDAELRPRAAAVIVDQGASGRS